MIPIAVVGVDCRFPSAPDKDAFWRLLMEPRKLWKRYLTNNSEFSLLAGLEVIARRLGRPPTRQGWK